MPPPPLQALRERVLRMQNQEDTRQKELDTILKFSAIINSSLHIEDVLNYAMQWAEEFMDAEASTVYELDEQKGELFIRIARGKNAPLKGITLKLDEGIAGHVVRTRQPIVAQDVRQEKFFSDKFDRKTGFETRSMICVPLILRGKAIGALQVLNKKSGGSFAHSDTELLISMSQQIAIALENAKLYKRLEKKFELTEQELKNTQEKLIRTERLVAMSHLVQGVAHEIRNPVTTIGGFAGRLKEELKERPKLEQYINIILEESERLENLVKRVGEFANVLSAALTADDIKHVLYVVLKRYESVERTQGVSIVKDIDGNLPLIMMDAPQLAIALSNIIENAIESMPHGGELRIEARQEYNNILIRILDTGRGIAPEDLDSVYDPFFTSKTRGAGLGLTMAHQILSNHNGEIKIQSQKGAITTVTLSLPIK